jgi:cytoskeletal protein CcmA (bactofilin family)
LSWWEKKSPQAGPGTPRPLAPHITPAQSPLEVRMPEPAHKTLSPVADNQSARTILGPSVTLRGELDSNEDLTIEGKFDGTLHLGDHCLTIGLQGEVKADIQASRTVVQGTVTGNITARERIEIRKTGKVMGDLVAPGISIEDGAYFKGSIEIVRDKELTLTPSSSVPTIAEA